MPLPYESELSKQWDEKGGLTGGGGGEATVASPDGEAQ